MKNNNRIKGNGRVALKTHKGDEVGRTGGGGMMRKLMRCGEEEMVEEEEGWWMKGEGLWMYYKRRRVEVAWMSSRLK